MSKARPRQLPARRRHRGLTLPEVALVILVIVLVAALLVPLNALWRKAKEHDRRVTCAGNLKQIGLANLMYTGDCGGFFQITGHGFNLEPLNAAALLADGKVYACPSASPARTLCAFSNYRYRGSGLKDDNDSATAVSVDYDQSGNHPGNQWLNVLFIDGHVEGAPPDGSKGWNTSD